MIGTDTSKKASSDSKPKSGQSDGHALLVNARCHGNFIENVPLALLVASIVEMNGGDRQVLTGSLAALLFFRIAHVELGLKAERALGWGRSVGYFGTLSWVLGMSTYAAWLVKSYWGL
ncbi:putative membrane-associated protein in eicosanoid and glutathione metabolism protein [Cladophialophora carrionii]|uniref:Putative membrane-associated protein in eicosanoid and glutathione metabolism protein n=1 Tax=Cladophialophora carrionii TaxID=86049 RepID=A0A1C1CZ33_9EURO|nr:putative membrane-associated protein in eicosanoid and glutathione metabolism protein [Cladophialophora carrionii]